MWLYKVIVQIGIR
jgi:hypothetical protein